MPEDVLDKLSTAIGRKIQPVATPQQPQAKPQNGAINPTSPENKQGAVPSLESVIGRKPDTVQGDPLFQQRFKMYTDARRNGIDADKAMREAIDKAAVLRAGPEKTFWSKTKDAIGSIPATPGGKRTLGDVGNDIAETWHRAWNPVGMSDEEWAKHQEQVGKTIEQIDQHILGKGVISEVATGVDQGAYQLLGEQASPGQIALMIGTFGGSALERVLWKVGGAAYVPAVRTLSKLMQLHFAASMLEGTATGIEGTIKNAVNGDWREAGKSAVEGLASGIMAKGLISHEQAISKVRGDLETASRQLYPFPEGTTGMQAALTSRFAQLDPYQQGLVIDRAVKASPEYQAVLSSVDAQDEEAKTKTKKAQQRRLNDYYGTALSQAWNPDVAVRTMRKLDIGRQRGAAMDAQARYRDEQIAWEQRRSEYFAEQIKAVRDQQELWRTQARDARPQKRQQAAQERSEVGKVASGIAEQRDTVWRQRNEAQAQGVEPSVPTRTVESLPDDEGNLTYPAMYWGEENTFGVSAGVEGHAVYRQTPRGTEWMDANGNFSEQPQSLFAPYEPETADTVARLTALYAQASTLADAEGATPEQIKEADEISGIRRDLLSGDINAREAQRRAGISEQAKLPDEYTAARDGKLNGPFHESNAAEFQDNLRSRAENAGMSPEDTAAVVENASMLARQQTESNLNHVYRPGDYIVSKRGVKWTLDSKGMLHPDDGGQPVPLMRRGLYSNDAVQLAGSGRVGYGTETREERRLKDARRRTTQEDIRANQEAVDREMRLSVQREGLQEALPEEPRADADRKRERAARIMSRPPRAPESGVGGIVRMVFKARSDANSTIQAIANRAGVTPEEVMRLALAGDPERSTTANIARLENGDSISHEMYKDRSWKVEQDKAGNYWLRSGGGRISLDRLNPSDRVRQIVERGQITSDRPEFKDGDANRVVYEKPHYVRYQEDQVEEIKDRAEGKAKDPEPVNERQATAQAKAATRRTDAAKSVATRAVVEALNPDTESVEKAEAQAVAANETIKVAEEGYAQESEAVAKAQPKGDFPQRAPASVGLKGAYGVISQNQREFRFHYELLPLDAVVTSHEWINGKMEINPDFPEALQPRTVNEEESRLNALRAERRRQVDDGKWVGYNFAEYGDSTINGSMGPVIVDEGGRAVGGNTRIAIMRRHLENLKAIPDQAERTRELFLFDAQMRKIADSAGVDEYPNDGIQYVLTRMLDKPIETVQEATNLGMLFNTKVGVEISRGAKGLAYARTLDKETLATIGRLVDAHDGIPAAMAADPEYFVNLVKDKFGITDEEEANWFRNIEVGNQTFKLLNDEGRTQIEKVLLGVYIKDASLLSRLEGKTPYRALTRALSYLVKMEAIPDRDITGKINEAFQAAADTLNTDPSRHASSDVWLATYHPSQLDLMGMEEALPPEPDRMVEALWRALHASDAGTPRMFNDRLKAFIGEESSRAISMFDEAVPTPAEAFNRAFSRELTDVQHSRGDKTRGLSEEEFTEALKNREIPEVDREAKENEVPKEPEKVVEAPPAKFEAPPKPPSPERAAARNLAETKARDGFVTSEELKTFLETNPATKDNAAELLRTARMMAEYVFDADPPPGVNRKQALDWVLKERLAGIEAGELKTKRGQYTDPNLSPEVQLGNRVMKLHKAADASSFIHEFAHVIFPMLSDEDLKAIDTIRGTNNGRVWDGTRKGLAGDSYRDLSEKLAHGLEQFLRDENPTGFTAEVKAVLAKIKSMMRAVYMKFASDPLAAFQNSEESREVFAKMFGITDFEVQDKWHQEVKKARAEENKMRRPEDTPHPIATAAAKAGADGIRNVFAGKVEDTVGERVDPRKPVLVFMFKDEGGVAPFWTQVGTDATVKGAELIRAEDGTYGVRFNTTAKVPSNVLYQDAPKMHPGIELEELKKRLASTPGTAPMLRKLLQLEIANKENEIRAKYGNEEPAPQDVKPIAKEALKEAKDGKPVREAVDGKPGLQPVGRPAIFSKPPTPPKLADAAAANGRAGLGGRGPVKIPATLADVKPVTILPLPNVRGEAVGTTVGEAFDSKGWVESLKRAGLPENLPAPTWALDPKTAAQLIFPGQKEVVQTALSALEQGDAAVVATTPGTGKTYSSMAIVKEWRDRNPEAKVLVITKNSTLLKKTGGVAERTFGFNVEGELPDGQIASGVYGTTYASIRKNTGYKNNAWDLVVADESGEARNWFKEENKQGKALMDITANTKKAVYLSATPFHSPMEYGYAHKLGLWPKNGFDKWIEGNFAHEKIDDKIVARLDPGKQAKLRQQLIERGQFISQAISYEGFNAHFGVVPVTDQMKRGLDRIQEGFARAKKQLIDTNKKSMADRLSAFEATYTKAFLERQMLPQAVELAKRARANGWQAVLFSETTAEDLFRRTTQESEDRTTYQQLDDAMGGQLSRIIPPFGNIYDSLAAEFGDEIGDYSGRQNTAAQRTRAKNAFLSGELPMLYATYAGAGVGGDFHDADYPELGIKGGDKPRVAIYIGPPYSGVLLEQSTGRTWRFGVKSDVHAVFLTTDSEPDVRLMQQKVGPRLMAVGATVLGNKDSLATAMMTYSSEEKTRIRQEALAYQEGNEQQITAAMYQVRSRSRNVGINDWSQINFPPADSAKNKGMKYGQDIPGGDWSTLYQNQAKLMFDAPPTPERIAGDAIIDAIGNGVMSGAGLPEGVALQNLDPADRNVVMGAASAVASEAVKAPGRDTRAAARQAMQAQMKLPGDRDKWVLTFPKGKKVGVWRYTGPPEDLGGGKIGEAKGPTSPKDVQTWYSGAVFSQEVGIKAIARQAGAKEAGDNIVRMNRGYQADKDVHFADFALTAEQASRENNLDVHDPEVMSELWDVVEGRVVSDNPAIMKMAEQLADLHERIHTAEGEAGVKLKTPSGQVLSWQQISKDRSYMPHRIDWDAQVEDPQDGKVYKLRDIMKETFAEASRRRIIQAIAKDRDYTYEQVIDYLKAYAPNTPVLGHIHRARTLNFPFIRKDWKTLMGYYQQAADAIAIEKNFGSERGKLDKEIGRIPSQNGRQTINSMFDSILKPQEWSDWTAKAYNAAIAFEAATKMTISATKVPFHLVHIPMGLKGRVMPMVKALAHDIFSHREMMDNAAMVGTVARQTDAGAMLSGEDSGKWTHQIFGKTGFNALYKQVRAIAGESSRVWMEQYAMRDLQKFAKLRSEFESRPLSEGNTRNVTFKEEDETRRMLRDVMLIGDHAIDEAIRNGRFAPEDLARGQVAFANMVAWSDNPLQMPGLARMSIEKGENTTTVGLKRAVRLTYALQSFAAKSTSLLREHLWDEVMIHKNYKPLVYAILAYPVIGQMLQGASAGAASFVHRGIEGATGREHQEDRWDRWLKEQEDTFGHPEAVKFLKWCFDCMTLSVGWDRARRWVDPLLSMAAGKGPGSSLNYLLADEADQILGPAWDEFVQAAFYGIDAVKVETAKHESKKQKDKKLEAATDKYIVNVVPIMGQVPGFRHPPKKTTTH
jgi:hypothetical protein